MTQDECTNSKPLRKSSIHPAHIKQWLKNRTYALEAHRMQQKQLLFTIGTTLKLMSMYPTHKKSTANPTNSEGHPWHSTASCRAKYPIYLHRQQSPKLPQATVHLWNPCCDPWIPKEPCEKLWNPKEHNRTTQEPHRIQWNKMESPGIPRSSMEPCGRSWNSMESYGKFWKDCAILCN